MPGRWIEPGRARASSSTGREAMPVKRLTTIPNGRGGFARPHCPIWTMPIRSRAISCATLPTPRTRCRMLPARVQAFRQLSRTGDEAVAVSRSCATSAAPNMRGAPYADDRRGRGRGGKRGSDAAVARGPGDAGGTDHPRQDSDTVRRLIAAWPSRFAKPSCCAKSKTFLTARSPTSRRCPSVP